MTHHDIFRCITSSLRALDSKLRLGGIVLSTSKRMTSTIAYASITWDGPVMCECEIRFSSVVFPRLGHTRQREVVHHEVAHIVAAERHGQDGLGHGVAWKGVMSELGYSNPRACVPIE